MNSLVGELPEIPRRTNRDTEVRDRGPVPRAAQSCRVAKTREILIRKILSRKIPSHAILKTTCARRFPRRRRIRRAPRRAAKKPAQQPLVDVAGRDCHACTRLNWATHLCRETLTVVPSGSRTRRILSGQFVNSQSANTLTRRPAHALHHPGLVAGVDRPHAADFTREVGQFASP